MYGSPNTIERQVCVSEVFPGWYSPFAMCSLTNHKHANHMTMTTSGQIMSWSDCLKTKGNGKIKLRDLCEILIVYILLSRFQLVHMVLTVNKPDVRRFITWIEPADWNLWSVNYLWPANWPNRCTSMKWAYLYHFLLYVFIGCTG